APSEGIGKGDASPLNVAPLQRRRPRTGLAVWSCLLASDREIARHARAGMNFDDIQFELGVATQCGQCEGCARDVVNQCNALHPVAALQGEARSHTVQVAACISESAAWPSSPSCSAA